MNTQDRQNVKKHSQDDRSLSRWLDEGGSIEFDQMRIKHLKQENKSQKKVTTK